MASTKSSARFLALFLSIFVVIGWALVGLAALTNDSMGLLLAPLYGWLPGKVWVEPVRVAAPWLVLAMGVYTLFLILAWTFKEKAMAVLVPILAILGTLLFVMRFLAEMGNFFR